jgi:hypothetical protein
MRNVSHGKHFSNRPTLAGAKNTVKLPDRAHPPPAEPLRWQEIAREQVIGGIAAKADLTANGCGAPTGLSWVLLVSLAMAGSKLGSPPARERASGVNSIPSLAQD